LPGIAPFSAKKKTSLMGKALVVIGRDWWFFEEPASVPAKKNSFYRLLPFVFVCIKKRLRLRSKTNYYKKEIKT